MPDEKLIAGYTVVWDYPYYRVVGTDVDTLFNSYEAVVKFLKDKRHNNERKKTV